MVVNGQRLEKLLLKRQLNLNLGGLSIWNINNSHDFLYTYQTEFSFNANPQFRGNFLVENVKGNLLTSLGTRDGETQYNIKFGLNDISRNAEFDYVGQSNGSMIRIFTDGVCSILQERMTAGNTPSINSNLIVNGKITQNGSNAQKLFFIVINEQLFVMRTFWTHERYSLLNTWTIELFEWSSGARALGVVSSAAKRVSCVIDMAYRILLLSVVEKIGLQLF